MEGPDVAFALLVALVPALLWLAWGVVVGAGKKTLVNVRLGRFRDFSKSPEREGANDDAIVVRAGFAMGSFVSELVFDACLIVSDAALNVARVVIANLSILVIFWATFVLSTIVLSRNREIVYFLDTTYEALRPTYVETLLHVFNFARVLYALFVGVWNAAIEIVLLPIRVLFDSAFRCGGTEFIGNVALAASNVARALALSVRDLFVRLYGEKTLDVDVTEVVRTSRLFLQEFAEVIECACESIAAPTIRAAAHPVYSSTTDVFVNNATRAVVKLIEIPYVAATTGSTSFAPLFDVVLSEKDGVLASGARLGNEYLREIVEFVQVSVPREFRFDSPPIFSLFHRSAAVFGEMARSVVDTIGELPVITQSDGPTVADVVHESATANRVKFNANQFAKVLFNDTLVALHPYFQVYGEALTLAVEATTELIELTYNSTLDAITGTPASESTPNVARDYAKGTSECEFRIAYSDDIVGRPRMAINLWTKKYSTRVVPIQIAFLEEVRGIVAFKFFSVAIADSLLALSLSSVRAVEAVLRLASYLTDSLLRFDYVSRVCTDAFTADAWEKTDDFLTSLPNVVTSLASFDDTYESGYSNIACARTTHVDHVYSGSLKAYAFASGACRTKYKDGASTPKCPYRDDDPAVEAALCGKLTAFAEYNTNPLCNGGDTLAEVAKSVVLVWRTYADYFLGTLVGVWNCMIDAGDLDFAGCAESLSGEIVPSRAVFDLAECQTAELVYRLSATIVSAFTPLFDTVYVKSEYPKNGFYAKGADDLKHAQARPVEVAFVTLLSSAGGVVFYPMHVLADLGRDVSTMLDGVAKGTFDVAEMFAYRRTFFVIQLRSLILFFRDIIVALTQLARAVDTVTSYEEARKAGEESPDPMNVSADFVAFQRTIGDVLDIIQSTGDLLSETFVEGVEAFFEMFFYLLEALVKTALGDGSAGNSLAVFFESFIDKLGSLASDVIDGIFRIVVRKRSDGATNPFRVLLCDILGALKDSVCSVVTVPIVPTRLTVTCLTDEDCAWMPNGGISLVPGVGVSSQSSFASLNDRINPITSPFGGLTGGIWDNGLTSVLQKSPLLNVLTGESGGSSGGSDSIFGFLSGGGFGSSLFPFGRRRRRRRLLGGNPVETVVGAVTDPVGTATTAVGTVVGAVTDPVGTANDIGNAVIGGANDAAGCAEDPEQCANDAGELAEEAWKGAVSSVSGNVDALIGDVSRAVNDMGDIVGGVKDVASASQIASGAASGLWNWVQDITDTIQGSIPKRFSVTSSSIADLIGMSTRSMQCNVTGFRQCGETAHDVPARQEPTVCSSEFECHATDAYCWTPDSSACLSEDFVAGGGEKWAKSCRCDLLAGGKHHCNYATGYCEMGVTPFAPPLDECASSGGLISGSDGYDRLCFVSPVWKCAGHPDPEHCRTLVGSETLPLQGPSLCRSFCAPTWENRNNRLAQLIFADGTRKCACEVGFDRAFPSAASSTTAIAVVNVLATYQIARDGASGVTGRRKLTEAADGRRIVRPFTKCASTTQCAPTFASPTVCRSLWGDPTPCYSCSERVHGDERGYSCDAEEKECACTVEREADLGEEHVVDVGEWRGNAWCDKIMRGYKTGATRSVLERAWIHRCTVYKIIGQRIVAILGVPTIPPDFLYNPGRLLSIAGDAVQGIHVYYSEGFSTRDADLRVAFFDRLVEKRVDPLVTFAVLGAVDTAFSVGRVVYSKIDMFAVVKTVLRATDQRAELAFERGTSRTTKEIIKTYDAAVKRNVDYATLATGSATVAAKVARLVTTATVATTKVVARNTTAATTKAVARNVSDSVSSVVSSTRALLEVAECEVIVNVRERASVIADTLSRYYGEEDGFVAASLCAYETFLTKERTCPFPNGQANDNTTAIALDNPFSFAMGSSKTSVTVGSFVRFLFDASDRAIRELDDANDAIVDKIVDASEAASGTVSRCSPEILLCEKRNMSLANAAWITESWAFVVFLAFKLLGVTSVGLGTFLAAQVTVIPAAVLSLAYDYSATCLPRLPVCVGDDFFAILRAFFPAHVEWSGLVSDPRRTPHPSFPWLHVLDGGDARIVDCRIHGFYDQLDAYFWLSAKIGSGPVTALIEWPLVVAWERARRRRARWRDAERTPIVDDCGRLVAVGAVPVVILSLLFYVTVSFATIPCVRAGAKTVSRAKKTVVTFFIFALEVYNH